TDPSAGVEQKDHQGAQMSPGSGNQTFGLFGSEPSQPPRRFCWPLHHDMRAPTALSGMLYDRRYRRVELAISGSTRGVRIALARPHIDGDLIDLCERRSAKIADDLMEKAFITALLNIAQRGFGEGSRSATTVDGLSEDFGLALCSDFLRDFLVVSSSAST